MHEFSAACAIVQTAVEAAEEHNAKKVNAVNVEIGEFTFLFQNSLNLILKLPVKRLYSKVRN